MPIDVVVSTGLRRENTVASDEWLVASKRAEKKRGSSKFVWGPPSEAGRSSDRLPVYRKGIVGAPTI